MKKSEAEVIGRLLANLIYDGVLIPNEDIESLKRDRNFAVAFEKWMQQGKQSVDITSKFYELMREEFGAGWEFSKRVDREATKRVWDEATRSVLAGNGEARQ